MSSENVCLICVNFVSNIVIVTSHGVLFFLLGEGEAEDCFLFSSIQLFLQCFISHSDCTSRAVYTLLAKSITSASEIFLLTYIFYVK